MTDHPDDTSSKSLRKAIRFAPEDVAWLKEQADDEGVEPATLVRMIIARLRKGRAPLISMMEHGQTMPAPIVRTNDPQLAAHHFEQGDAVMVTDGSEADSVLQARLAEIDSGAEVIPLHPDPDEAPAVSLHRVARNAYNPGRQ